jgi:predicted amidohydrolase
LGVLFQQHTVSSHEPDNSPGATVVAAIQFKPWRGAVEENRRRLIELIATAARAGAELVVAPEMCNSGYVFPHREAILPYCEPRGGATHQLFTEMASSLDITLAYGWPEIEEGTQRLFNSASVLFPDGRTLFYRKRLLYESDTTWAEPGDTPYPIWTTKSGLQASLGICMDLNDERFRRHLREAKVRLCAFPTNWLDQGFVVWNYWAYCLQGSQTCLAAANTYGVEDETPFRGESAILDGRVLLGYAESTGDDIVIAQVPPTPTPLRRPDR